MIDYNLLLQAVKKQIDAFDAYGLLAGGAPKDEFDGEAEMIASRMKKGMTADIIAEIMAQIMNEQFENIFKAKEFLPYAKEIEKFLNKMY